MAFSAAVCGMTLSLLVGVSIIVVGILCAPGCSPRGPYSRATARRKRPDSCYAWQNKARTNHVYDNTQSMSTSREASMGHIVNSPRAYRLLQQRLDRNVTGAPDSPVLRQILELLFQPEEAELAAQIPTNFVSLRRLARRTGIEPPVL